MLLRTTDPFRDFDRLTSQLLGTSLGTTNRPAVMPMDAWREGDVFHLDFDLPGVATESIDLDVERNVLTVRAERVAQNGDWEMLASERPRGIFSRQLVLGDNLDLDQIQAHLRRGSAPPHHPGGRTRQAPQDRGRHQFRARRDRGLTTGGSSDHNGPDITHASGRGVSPHPPRAHHEGDVTTMTAHASPELPDAPCSVAQCLETASSLGPLPSLSTPRLAHRPTSRSSRSAYGSA